MNLKQVIKFVGVAVNPKSTNEHFQHYCIENGHIRASDGILSAGSPIDISVDGYPLAEDLNRAVRGCGDVVSIKIVPSGRLAIKSGKFRVLVPMLPPGTTTAHPKPTGHRVEGLDTAMMMEAFENLSKFVGKEDLRPWTNGILLRGHSAYATNNVCLVQYYLGAELPFSVNVPLVAVNAVLKSGKPDIVMVEAASITFMYEDGRWLRSQLYDTSWPEKMYELLDTPNNTQPIHPDFFKAVKAITPFTGEERRAYFRDGEMHSSRHGEGATYAVEGLEAGGIYRVEMLSLLDGVAERADWSMYPKPVIFYGGRMRGAILGMSG